MKTKTKKKNKVRAIIVRDLLKPIYSVGCPTPGEPLISDLQSALDRATAGKSFYLWHGGDQIYHVLPGFYSRGGTPLEHVCQRLREIFPPPPEAIGL